MTINIFDHRNWHLYKSWFSDHLTNYDIYYNPAFLECEANCMKGECFVFLATDNTKNFFAYPFIKKQIPIDGFENYFDVTSPYGYCGPVTNTNNIDFFLAAENELCKYFSNQNVVNEFIRYHYYYNKDYLFRLNVSNSKNREIVLVDTTVEWQRIWMEQFSATNRNLIRKMEKEGYIFQFTDSEEKYVKFIEMYYETMDNAKADSYYYFNKDYFATLKDSLCNSLKFCIVEKDDVIYSAALFFVTPTIATYYLSARNLAFSKVPAVNFLLAKSIQAFQATSVTDVNLGGGTTSEHNNSLLKFKLNFSRKIAEFKIGRRIHLPDVYENMQNKFISNVGLKAFEEKKHILQFYR